MTPDCTFEIVFDLSPIGKALTAPDGTLLRVNSAFANMLGYGTEDLVGRGFLGITAIEDRPSSEELLRRLTAIDGPGSVEKRYLHKDGHEVWALVSSRLVRDAHGNPDVFVTTIQDISERKRVENALADREAHLRLLFETMPIGWAEHRMLFDEGGAPWDYIFLQVNKAFERFTGLRAEAILGRRVTEVIPGIRESEPDLVSVYGEVVRRTTETRLEIYFEPLGRWYGLTAFSRGEDRFVVMFEDITRRKTDERDIHQSNEALRRANQRIRAANEELEAFAYSVSHDLRQPLRAIDGFSRVLVERYAGALDSGGRDYLARVRAAAQRMGNLIDDLLGLSRMTRIEMRLGPVDLSAVAHRVCSQLQAEMPDRTVCWVIADELPVEGDERLLEMVLRNLMDNAWKYTSHQAEARIEVGREEVGGETVYFVRDDGAGFDMRYASKLFGAFQRLHGVDEFPGTGIGLATVQRIVHRHGGRVWAHAAVGKGATFYFTLGTPVRGARSEP
jgi:PAS domain S-box-containing protein